MTAEYKILLVDDEEAITATLGPFLERSGYVVAAADDGIAAMAAVANFGPDLILLDILMPRMDGREFLRLLRQKGNWVPVILLTQVDTATERAMALNEGADDYIHKQCDPSELLARIGAVLRRSRPDKPTLAAGHRLVCGDLSLDRRSGQVYLGAEETVLPPKSFELLLFMMMHPQELLTRERLLDLVWGWNSPLGSRAVDVRVAELRAALRDEHDEPRYIETVRGRGYRFKGKVEVSE